MKANGFWGAILLLCLVPAACGAPSQTTMPVQVTASPAPTRVTQPVTSPPTQTLSTSPIAYPGRLTGRVGMLADGQIRIADLEENRILEVEGAYVQLAGWSPSGAYLLAAQEDSQYTVIQAEGQVLYTTTGLPQPAFWAPPDALYEDEEMLALPQRDGSLAGLTFPSQKVRQVLPPGSLGADGMAVVRWGTGGNLIVTPSLEQIQQRISFAGGDLGGLEGNGPDAQNLATRGADGQFSGAGPVSMDSHQAYYQVLDGVPGSQSALVLAAEIRGGCSSCQTDGLPLVTLEGDMRDLSLFPDGSFDLIVHPVSNLFVPDVRPVWREAYHVLRPGGTLLAGFLNPVFFLFDFGLHDKGVLQIRHALPYSDLTSISEQERLREVGPDGPLEFGHTLEDQIGGQLEAGFVLVGLYEDRHRDMALSKYTATFMATRALKPG